MRNAKTGRLILAIAGSLACHVLVLIALRSERPIVVAPSPAVEVSLMREPEAAPRLRPPMPDRKQALHRTDAAAPRAPSTVEPLESAPAPTSGPIEARAETAAPAAAPTPATPAPAKLVFDCDDLTLKSVARERCPTKRLARRDGKLGAEQVAFARQAQFDAEKAQKNGGPIVIGHLTLRPAPDANSDPNLITIFKFSF